MVTIDRLRIANGSDLSFSSSFEPNVVGEDPFLEVVNPLVTVLLSIPPATGKSLKYFPNTPLSLIFNAVLQHSLLLKIEKARNFENAFETQLAIKIFQCGKLRYHHRQFTFNFLKSFRLSNLLKFNFSKNLAFSPKFHKEIQNIQ